MEQEILTTIQSISYPAAIVFIFIILNKAGLLSLLMDFFRGKINKDADKTIHEKLNKIESNDLHEVDRRLGLLEAGDLRIEDRLNKISEDVSWLKAKINNK